MINNRAAIREWFDAPRPVVPVRASAGGAFAALCGLYLLVHSAVGFGLFIILVVAGVTAFRYWQYGNVQAQYLARPSITQMTDWLAGDIRRLRDTSLSRCGLDPAQVISPSGVIAGPVFWDEKRLSRQATSRRLAVDDSRLPHQYLYGCWELHAFHFGQGMMMLYSCTYDWYSDTVVGEHTEGVPFDRIVSVRTGDVTEGVDTYIGHDDGGIEFVLAIGESEELELSTGGGLLQPANVPMLKGFTDDAVKAIHVARQKWANRPTAPVMNVANAVVVQQVTPAPPVSKFCTQCGVPLHGDERNCRYCASPTGFAVGGHTLAKH